ncbi:MAG TPA: hypothetical protein VK211_14555 [Kamptonema sp.]|nr:hypothetical protein [Kamptonema sp.]
MALFDDTEFTSQLPLGEFFRLPRKFIRGKSSAGQESLEAIAKQLKARGRNISPLIVKVLAEDSYEAVLNTQVLDAAKLASLDFVWCIAVDDEMFNQVKVELGIKEVVKPKQINLCLASESEIADAIALIKSQTQGFGKVEPKKVARLVVEYRTTKKPVSLNFLTKLNCGIGKAKLPVLGDFLAVQ